ncbi:4-hydroxythreonine-4-phosphate dehydrogenase PdxA [Rhizobium skierniewicense]|uniref:4-hydroxythreonine-4-phosphate dehydrogenase PdxA n=1 Tax=Rhizobium skierniewicense TaxID=984260 RepID=UPI001FAD8862|nr:4-hydroxythreonine-4-phosphate dehydrogenase PdxA [Rhizobium skierniewicense]MCI9865957.1 4-hydroxythreonine-4-phosphate dehydrogenase PdxA [Rhizobium skierniewicense]
MTLQNITLAVTQGDPAGIGPDITIVAWSKRKELGLPPFILVGDPDVISSRAHLLGIDCPVEICEPEQAAAIFPNALPVFAIPVGFDVLAGQPHVGAALATIKAIETAVQFTVDKRVSAVVTNPIAKSVLYEAGFGYPGHTEFLAELAKKLTGQATTPVMMIAGPKLRVVPVTIHIPIAEVPGALTEELIVKTCRIIAADLKEKFGIQTPRLAVAGLNPHAGEDGAIGTEDGDIIHPATVQLRKDGIDAFGPLPADTMFHDAARRRYDVAVCMYHDQALIPAKALGFDDSVNVTLGLPFIRTSPDHGTAFGIAGQGIANESSLVAALKMASEIAARRANA